MVRPGRWLPRRAGDGHQHTTVPPPQGSSRAPRSQVGHSHVPAGRAREVRAPESWAWPLPPAPGAGRQREQGCRCPSRTLSPSHSIGPGGPGGAARLEASPGEAGPSQRTRSSSGEAWGGPCIRQQLRLWGPRLAGWSSMCWGVCWPAGKPRGRGWDTVAGRRVCPEAAVRATPACGHIRPESRGPSLPLRSPAGTGGRPGRESLGQNAGKKII